MAKTTKKCKYCNGKASTGELCTECYKKRKLIREMQDAGRDLVERLKNEQIHM